MKKLLLSILAIAAITACSKSEVEYDAPTQIGISPVAQNVTKAMLTDTEFPNEQFNVWAFYKQIPQGTTIAQWQDATTLEQTTYIEEKPFKQTTANTKLWGGVVPYYWPKIGSLLFAGYYPTTAADKVSYTFDGTTNQMKIEGYTPAMVQANANNYNEDFMYFKMTATSYDGTTQSDIDVTGNNVDVVFKHALSWISVSLAKSEDTPAGATITVNSVKFTDILPSGDGVVDNSKDSDIVWTAIGTAADIELCPDDDATTDVKENQVTLTTTATTLVKEPILIPQTMAGKTLVIEYTISSTDGSSFTETKTITLTDLTEGSTTEADSWNPAKHYNYNVVIGTSEILIDPTVTAWIGVTGPITVQ